MNDYFRTTIFLLATLVLAACAGGPAQKQPVLSSPTLTRNWIEGEGGIKLRLNTWPAKGRQRAVILAAHGYGDTGELTYHRAAEYWATKGITTYAYDHRGFGRNASYKKWAGPETMIADLQVITARIRAQHPDVPLTVIGHSMGGGVVLGAAGRGLDADRIVLAGPAITGGQGVNPIYRLFGWAAGVAIPEKRFTGDGLISIQATDNRDAVLEALAEPRRISDPSARELYGLVRLMDTANETIADVTIPTMTLIGAKDEIFNPRQIERVHNQIPGAEKFILYPEGWHWLFRDLQAENVWRDVVDFATLPQKE